MKIHGRVIEVISDIDEGSGASVFRFFPEEDVKCDQRHHIICSGRISYVQPGLPLQLTVEHKGGIRYDFYQSRIISSKKSYSMFFLKNIKGISDKTATKILEGLDNDISRLANMDDPEEYLDEIKGSGRYKKELLATLQSAFGKENLYNELMGIGLELCQVTKLEKLYGPSALKRFQENPYEVGEKLGLSFITEEYIAKHYRGSRFAINRMKATVIELLKKNEENGNTRITIQKFIDSFYYLLKKSAWPCKISPAYLFSVLHTMHGICIKDGYIFFCKRYYQEAGIAKYLSRFAANPKIINITDYDVDEIQANLGIQYYEAQKKAIKTMARENLMVLIGKPGTGKTTVIRGIIELFRQKYPKDATQNTHDMEERISLCAPTAQAAQILKNATGHNASTIHLLVGIVPYGNDFLGKNESDPLSCELLVVDEMSMVDTETFYLLMRSIKPGCKIVLCGDPDQLDSVGCGSIFSNIIESGLFPIVELNQFMRQGTESVIPENCRQILRGNSKLLEDQNFHCMTFQTEEDARKYIEKIYPRNGDSLKKQILSITKMGMLGTIELNNFFSKEGEGRGERICFRGSYYQIGDKVVFIENNYEKGFVNGDIGIVTEINESVKILVGTKTIMLEKYELQSIQLATVMTTHKSQGAEYDQVYILLPEEPRILLNQNILNTAISRAKKEVYLISVGRALELAVSNRMKKKRDTWLPIILKTGNFYL